MKPLLSLIIQCVVLFYAGILLLCWITGTSLLPEKRVDSLKAVGWNGGDIIYEDATGKMFTLGPDNRCIVVGKIKEGTKK